jgi:hypothetical protein
MVWKIKVYMMFDFWLNKTKLTMQKNKDKCVALLFNEAYRKKNNTCHQIFELHTIYLEWSSGPV